MGNPEPVFAARGVRVLVPPRVLKEKHVKMRLRQNSDGNGADVRSFDGLAWRMAERVQAEGVIAGDLLDVAFTVEENTHPDFGGLQLSICDFARKNGSALTTAVGKN